MVNAYLDQKTICIRSTRTHRQHNCICSTRPFFFYIVHLYLGKRLHSFNSTFQIWKIEKVAQTHKSSPRTTVVVPSSWQRNCFASLLDTYDLRDLCKMFVSEHIYSARIIGRESWFVFLAFSHCQNGKIGCMSIFAITYFETPSKWSRRWFIHSNYGHSSANWTFINIHINTALALFNSK